MIEKFPDPVAVTARTLMPTIAFPVRDRFTTSMRATTANVCVAQNHGWKSITARYVRKRERSLTERRTARYRATVKLRALAMALMTL